MIPAHRPGRARSGTVLLLCLAIVITLTVLVYGFLRVAQLGYGAGDSVNRQLLAKEATLMGTNHAYEQIVRDYVTQPFARQDGPAIAPFISEQVAYAIDGAQGQPSIDHMSPGYPTRIGWNDGAVERLAYEPVECEWWNGYQGPYLGFEAGDITYDGRGRYYEPNCYFLAATGAATAPTVPLPFTGAWSATAAAPDRNGAIYYDKHWHRITDPPAVARDEARYRLRYNVGVINLDGDFVMTGDPALDYRYLTSADPAQVPAAPAAIVPGDPGTLAPMIPSRAQVQRGVRYQHAVEAVMNAYNNWNGLASAARSVDVFSNRGFAGNFDQANVGANPDWTPVTYPLMYRRPYLAQLSLEKNGYTWPPPQDLWQADDLFKDDGANGGTVVMGNPAGGETIQPGTGYPYGYTMHRALVGPQYTFKNLEYAVLGGGSFNGSWFECGSDGLQKTWGALTPFGRGLRAGDADPRFSGQAGADTPFSVNILTAPANVVYSMVAAYMPPGAMIAYYHAIGAGFPGFNQPPTYPQVDPSAPIPDGRFYSATPASMIYGTPTDLNPPGCIPPPPYQATGSCVCAPLYGTRDLFVPQLSQAFGPGYGNYASPTRTTPFGPIAPDYHLQDFHPLANGNPNPAFRAPADRYPGPMAYNGYDLVNGTTEVWRYDCLGMYLRATNAGTQTQPIPRKAEYNFVPTASSPYVNGNFDPQSFNPFWPVSFWRPYSYWTPGWLETSENKKLWGFDYYYTQANTPYDSCYVMPFPFSIWEVIGQAMGDTAMVARAQWQQYPSYNNASPATMFNGGPWSGPKVQSMHDLDALFLANLGIDINNPTSPTPVTAWMGGQKSPPPGNYIQSFTPAWNLASLADQPFFNWNDPNQPDHDPSRPSYSALQRTQIMETIINDFRLSFFGSSPGYAATFQALDLNGDGQVNCSAFPSSGVPAEVALHIDQHAAGTSVAPTVFFSNTGCFTIGKGRYWRIFSRGEVWDNLLNKTVSEAMLDTVVCVDPAGDAHELGAPATQHPAQGQVGNHVLYQRWFWDKYRGHLKRTY
jgi:hypothetical protein